MQGDRVERNDGQGKVEHRKILVLGSGEAFSEDVMGYAIQLADRLDYDLFAVTVLRSAVGPREGGAVARRAERFIRKAARKGIHCDHTVRYGELDSVVEAMSVEAKRVEFVVTDVGVRKEEIAGKVTVPIFSVIPETEKEEGGREMGEQMNDSKKSKAIRMVAYGAASAVLYAAVFWKADTLMSYFTRGGMYAALPIATAFLFSFVHGAFASNLWSLLGIEARKGKTLHEVDRKVVQDRKRATKRPRVYAYVNPFHRMDK